MRFHKILVLFVILPIFARGDFASRELTNVPIDRLITNMESKIKKEPNNSHHHYILARAHSMAYAQQTSLFVTIDKEDEPYFSFESEDWVFTQKVVLPENKKISKERQKHLQEAVSQFKTALKLKPDDFYSGLGLGWCLEQSGDTSKAIQIYKNTLDTTWNVYNSSKDPNKNWTYTFIIQICEETGNYLLKLLDPVKDADEIKLVKQRIDDFEKVPRGMTPILIPLHDNTDFKNLINPNAKVSFDLDGSGVLRKWGWIQPDAGWLVFDKNNTGNIYSGIQFLGNVTFWIFWKNGYEALASLDDNHDGFLRGNELSGLCIWQDINSNGLCEKGELKPLSAWGITGLSTHYITHPNGFPYSPNGVQFSNGSHRPSYDWLPHSSP